MIIVVMALVMVLGDFGFNNGGSNNQETTQEETIILIQEDQILVNNSEVNLNELEDELSNPQEPIEVATDNARLVTYRNVIDQLEELNLSYFEKQE